MPAVESRHGVFQAIAEPTRRRMLKLLAGKEMSIASVVEQFPISRTAVNKHLHVLSDAGLVSKKRVGRETQYSLKPQRLYEVKEWLAFFEQYWDQRLDALRQYVESEGDD